MRLHTFFLLVIFIISIYNSVQHPSWLTGAIFGLMLAANSSALIHYLIRPERARANGAPYTADDYRPPTTHEGDAPEKGYDA